MGKVTAVTQPKLVPLTDASAMIYAEPDWAALKQAGFIGTLTEYDGLGRTVEVSTPGDTQGTPRVVVSTQYNGPETTVTDAGGHQKTSRVDHLGRLIEVEEELATSLDGDPCIANQPVTTFAYDKRSLLTNVTDCADNETVIVYDGLGRKISLDDPDIGHWVYGYNTFSEMTFQRDSNLAEITFEYDGLGRVTERWAKAYGQPMELVAQYFYDDVLNGNKGKGRLTSSNSGYDAATDSLIVADAITYDLRGQAIRSDRTISGTLYTTLANYDELGRVISTTLPGGEVVETTYNQRGLFETLVGTDTYVSSTDYTATGAIKHQELGNGVENQFDYSEFSNRLISNVVGNSPYAYLVDVHYKYTPKGNIHEIDDQANEELRTYGYDALDRLISAGVKNGAGQSIEQRGFSYDQLGNLLSMNVTLSTAAQMRGLFLPGGMMDSTNFQGRSTFNPFTQLGMSATGNQGAAITPYTLGSFGFTGVPGPFGNTVKDYTYSGVNAGPHAVTSTCDEWDTSNPPACIGTHNTYQYDDNGNMTQRIEDGVTWIQTFDAENHLISVSGGGTTTTYVYDADGNRVKRTVNDGTPPVVTTLYVPSMEIELHGTTEDHRTVYYAAGGAFRVIGGSDAGLYFRLTDHLGSTSLITTDDGIEQEDSRVLYAPFGEIRSGALSSLTDFGFTGQRNDSSTGGLMYYGARYYLPGLGRFISADTVLPNTGSVQSLNRYSYVHNSPLSFIDPTGHQECRTIECGGGSFDSAQLTATQVSEAARWFAQIDGEGIVIDIQIDIDWDDVKDAYDWAEAVVDDYEDSQELDPVGFGIAILMEIPDCIEDGWGNGCWAGMTTAVLSELVVQGATVVGSAFGPFGAIVGRVGAIILVHEYDDVVEQKIENTFDQIQDAYENPKPLIDLNNDAPSLYGCSKDRKSCPPTSKTFLFDKPLLDPSALFGCDHPGYCKPQP
jgi:RHS repeat-associated protein